MRHAEQLILSFLLELDLCYPCFLSFFHKLLSHWSFFFLLLNFRGSIQSLNFNSKSIQFLGFTYMKFNNHYKLNRHPCMIISQEHSAIHWHHSLAYSSDVCEVITPGYMFGQHNICGKPSYFHHGCSWYARGCIRRRYVFVNNYPVSGRIVDFSWKLSNPSNQLKLNSSITTQYHNGVNESPNSTILLHLAFSERQFYVCLDFGTLRLNE